MACSIVSPWASSVIHRRSWTAGPWVLLHQQSKEAKKASGTGSALLWQNAQDRPLSVGGTAQQGTWGSVPSTMKDGNVYNWYFHSVTSPSAPSVPKLLPIPHTQNHPSPLPSSWCILTLISSPGLFGEFHINRLLREWPSVTPFPEQRWLPFQAAVSCPLWRGMPMAWTGISLVHSPTGDTWLCLSSGNCDSCCQRTLSHFLASIPIFNPFAHIPRRIAELDGNSILVEPPNCRKTC